MLKRVVIGLLGIALIVVGTGIGTGVWWLWQAFGAQGGLVRDLGVVQPSDGSAAVVIDIAAVDIQVPYVSISGRTELLADDAAGSVTMLASDAAAANAYLDGSPYDVASFTGSGWSTASVPGDQTLRDAASVDWISTARGAPAALPVATGSELTVVVVPASADSSSIDLALRFTVPDIEIVSLIGAILAALIAVTGLVLLWVASFALRRSAMR